MAATQIQAPYSNITLTYDVAIRFTKRYSPIPEPQDYFFSVRSEKEPETMCIPPEGLKCLVWDAFCTGTFSTAAFNTDHRPKQWSFSWNRKPELQSYQQPLASFFGNNAQTVPIECFMAFYTFVKSASNSKRLSRRTSSSDTTSRNVFDPWAGVDIVVD
ncbi:hypothetical protein SCHPADRAFT_896441 [Schizopora paradoxa]|uniref:Uncharacterized protein n=1 Tax=Schizopora paradoxa TaxID=27342 RepID=A0A0H2R0A7_9AGAM|nr:hypothetical protein SCHPADRAFT_896441 [Schizopora paradoxa]